MSKSVDDVSVLVFDSVLNAFIITWEYFTGRITVFVVVVLGVVKTLTGGRNLMVDFDDFISCTRQEAGLLASGK